MTVDTVFVTRYVADHEAALRWYEAFFGRPPTNAPMPNCREWEVRPGLVFQVIHDPGRTASTTFAFGVDDLDAARARLAEAGTAETRSFDVAGFDDLAYVEYTDPEGVTTGLLNTPGTGSQAGA